MPVPKTLEECEARARAAATEAIEDWENRTVQYDTDLAEERYWDVYADELYELHALMDDGRFGNGISRHAEGLVDICIRLRFETDAPSALGIAVGAIIGAAEANYQHAPDTALAEVVAALVGIFGADKVREAIDKPCPPAPSAA